jgi:hypothetical protein
MERIAEIDGFTVVGDTDDEWDEVAVFCGENEISDHLKDEYLVGLSTRWRESIAEAEVERQIDECVDRMHRELDDVL